MAVGRAFRRLWAEPSKLARAEMRRALMGLSQCLHDHYAPPEAAVVTFKNSIYCFGGVRAFPTLVTDHYPDGQECAAAYADAYSEFIRAFFRTDADRH